MSQISIDDIAWEYQLDLPVVKPTVIPIMVGNDLVCVTTVSGQACIQPNTYRELANPADFAVVKAYLNNKALQALQFSQHSQSVRNMMPMVFPSNNGSFPALNSKWSTIQVSGMAGNMTSVVASLFGYTSHDPCAVQSTNLVLQSPLGFAPRGVRAGVQIMYLVGNPLSWAPGSYDVTNLSLGFSDQAGAALCLSPFCTSPIVSGIYKCSSGNPNFGAITQPPPPSPLVPLTGYSVLMSSFNGVSPNGTWTLWGQAETNLGGQFTITGWGLDIITV